jgi:hypothetical protein
MRHLVLCVLAPLLLSACASSSFDVGNTETVLPMSRAWFDGQTVEYITTDISDAPMAAMMGANHVPGLAGAIKSGPGASLVERVYKFPGNEQISIFASAPEPAGPLNKSRNYTPLWRVVYVRWLAPSQQREIKSEEELLAAEERQQVALEVTNIVVNCPVTRSGGVALKGVR